jgi:penicillin-binding protein 1B
MAALVLLGTSLVVGFAGGAWFVSIDRVVRERFEGTLFTVPSRVYAAPRILYPGLDLETADVLGTLRRLGYREAPEGPVGPGRFRLERGKLLLHVRGFAHPSRPEPERDLLLRLSGGEIEEIRDLGTRRELGAVLLEPEAFGAYYGPEREQRELVRLAELPPHLVDAILAVEDRRFLTHHGLDPRRILGAFWANLRAGRVIQGGSTLTQQLVKNFFLTPERSLRRKFQEAAMALLVEARYEKPQILECYLNEIYLGQRGSTAVHGVGEAARLYFGKPVAEITAAEAALLAAIIQSPNGLSPHRDPEAARRRRDLVLRLMHEQGRLDDGALEAALAEPVGLAAVSADPREGRWFLEALRRQLPQFYDAATLASEGLRIYSTLDLRLQSLGARVLREELERLEKSYPSLKAKDGAGLEGCLVALRPQTGEVVALVGGRDYGRSQYDRCVQARRQAGSVFKPFVYVAALEPGPGGGPVITLASILDDSPLSVSTPSGPWRPANFDREFHGQVPVRDALERSMNVAAARLAQHVGVERVAELGRRLGLTSPLPEVPSLALGSADLAPLEIARAYATLASGGVRPEVRLFEDLVSADERTLEHQPVAFERVLDPGTAFLATSLLSGVVDRGTGRGVRAAGVRGPVAGKTGTTNDERDAWFAGYTPELVVVVWVGFDEPRSLGVPASRVALPVWARFLREATGGEVRGSFDRPSSIARLEIDPVTGARALPGCPRSEAEWFLVGTEPDTVCPGWASLAVGEADAPRKRGRSDDADRRPRSDGPGGWLERLFDSWLGRL